MERGKRKVLSGVVVSNKMNKTVIVSVSRTEQHHQYRKVITVNKRYYAHDEAGTCKEGDTISIVETRPMSKLKRWRVVEKVTS